MRLIVLAAMLMAALSAGISASHVLQIRGKARWDAWFWRTAMETLYRDYATAGAVIELGAIALAGTLAFLVRRHSHAFRWATAAAGLLAASFFGLWVGFVAPLNAVFATWTPETMPSDWRAYRDRWEVWHAVIAATKSLAVVSLTLSILGRAADHLPAARTGRL